jgi:hypothetical protein
VLDETAIDVPAITHASGWFMPQPASVAQSPEPGLVLIEVASVTIPAGGGTHSCHAPLAKHAIGGASIIGLSGTGASGVAGDEPHAASQTSTTRRRAPIHAS